MMISLCYVKKTKAGNKNYFTVILTYPHPYEKGPRIQESASRRVPTCLGKW